MPKCPYCDMNIQSLKSTHIDVCANVPPPRMLARIYRHGVSVHRIARFYGVSHQFIHNQLKRTGFKDVKRIGRAPMPTGHRATNRRAEKANRANGAKSWKASIRTSPTLAMCTLPTSC